MTPLSVKSNFWWLVNENKLLKTDPDYVFLKPVVSSDAIRPPRGAQRKSVNIDLHRWIKYEQC